jgi:hypothetical protein
MVIGRFSLVGALALATALVACGDDGASDGTGGSGNDGSGGSGNTGNAGGTGNTGNMGGTGNEGGTGNTGNTGPDATCTDLQGHMTECSLEEIIDFTECEPPPVAGVQCLYNCINNATCEDLTAAVCTGEAEVFACMDGCTFTCDNGEVIPGDYECDWIVDCGDSSDEHSACPVGFECADGSGDIHPDLECNFNPDCPDGSDEHDGCPVGFSCMDGLQEIPAEWECDGFDDCDDSSDEHAGCPLFTCTDASTIPAVWECDGFEDCPDSSDEHAGCPALPPDPAEELCGP